MKGKVIDYDFFEAYIVLEDDSIVKVPINSIPNYQNLGATVKIDTNTISCSSNSPKILQDKLIDYF